MSSYLIQIIYYAVSFLLFLFFTWRLSKTGNHQLFSENNPANQPGLWLLLQASGIVLFGLVIWIRNSIDLFELVFGKGNIDFIQIPVILICIFLILAISYKENKKAVLNNATAFANSFYRSFQFVVVYFLVRSVFIIVYEIWFRGYLLVDLSQAWGVPISVSVNLLLYFLIHIFNDKKILFGTFVFGLILCLLAIWLKATWPAIVLHLVLTLSAEGTKVINLYRKLKTTS